MGAKTFEPRRARTLNGVVFDSTALVGDAGAQKALVTADSVPVTVPAQLLLKSVGYKSISLKGVPFDVSRAVVPHEKGRVSMDGGDVHSGDGAGLDEIMRRQEDPESLSTKDGGMRQLSKTLRGMFDSPKPPTQGNEPEPNAEPEPEPDAEPEPVSVPAAPEDTASEASFTPLYVVGWLKRGPSGTIATSVTDAKETAYSVLEDLASASPADTVGEGDSDTSTSTVSGPDPAQRISALRSPSAISWQRYRQIDSYEVAAGQKVEPPKPRSKLIEREQMIELKASLRKKAQDRARQSRQTKA